MGLSEKLPDDDKPSAEMKFSDKKREAELACVSGCRQRDGIVLVSPGCRKWRITIGIKRQFWLGLRTLLGALLSTLQCLASLLIQECERFLCPSERDVWACTEKLL